MLPGPLYVNKQCKNGMRRKVAFELEGELFGTFRINKFKTPEMCIPERAMRMCPGARPLAVEGSNHNFPTKEGLQRVKRNGRAVFVKSKKAGDVAAPNENLGDRFPTGCSLTVDINCKSCYAFLDADIEAGAWLARQCGCCWRRAWQSSEVSRPAR